jgi:nucleoside-diphosphate-sugar epimerase
VPTAIVTGSGGLISSEAVAYLACAGFGVVALDNDMRSYFFAPEASTARRSAELERDPDGSFLAQAVGQAAPRRLRYTGIATVGRAVARPPALAR